jgi:hypothetical protein
MRIAVDVLRLVPHLLLAHAQILLVLEPLVEHVDHAESQDDDQCRDGTAQDDVPEPDHRRSQVRSRQDRHPRHLQPGDGRDGGSDDDDLGERQERADHSAHPEHPAHPLDGIELLQVERHRLARDQEARLAEPEQQAGQERRADQQGQRREHAPDRVPDEPSHVGSVELPHTEGPDRVGAVDHEPDGVPEELLATQHEEEQTGEQHPRRDELRREGDLPLLARLLVTPWRRLFGLVVF